MHTYFNQNTLLKH